MKSQLKGVILLLITTMLWGCSFVAQRTSVDAVEAFTFNTGRMCSAFLMMVIVVLVRQQLSRSKSRKIGDPDAAWPPPIEDKKSLLMGGLLCGLKREWAVRFAFLVSIPPILGSVILEIPDAIGGGTLDSSLAVPVILGMVIAAVSGLFAIKVMIKVVSNAKLTYFSIYTWIVGISLIVYSLVV